VVAESLAQDGGIIDAHAHFFDPFKPRGVPWPPRDDQRLYRQTYPANYYGAARGLGVGGVVAVECGRPVISENDWLFELATHEPGILAYIAYLDPFSSRFLPLLESYATRPVFRGIRIYGRDVRALLAAPFAVAHLEALARMNGVLEILTARERFKDVEALVRRLPSLAIALTHVGEIFFVDKPTTDDWQKDLRALAAHERVMCKLSALVEHTARFGDGAAAACRYCFETVLDLFGPRRLVFGSNWPVSERAAPLERVVGLAHELVSALSPSERCAVMRQNACTLYGLKLTSLHP
jgi:L-fuconolactonase